MRRRWVDLLFAHWPLAPDVLRPLLHHSERLDVRAWWPAGLDPTGQTRKFSFGAVVPGGAGPAP